MEVAAEDDCLAIGLRGNDVRFWPLADIPITVGWLIAGMLVTVAIYVFMV